MKPCEIPCPKCGSTSIRRTFYPFGKLISPVSIPRTGNSLKLNFFENLPGGLYRARKDFFIHVCAICRYGWETDELYKLGAEVSAEDFRKYITTPGAAAQASTPVPQRALDALYGLTKQGVMADVAHHPEFGWAVIYFPARFVWMENPLINEIKKDLT